MSFFRRIKSHAYRNDALLGFTEYKIVTRGRFSSYVTDIYRSYRTLSFLIGQSRTLYLGMDSRSLSRSSRSMDLFLYSLLSCLFSEYIVHARSGTLPKIHTIFTGYRPHGEYRHDSLTNRYADYYLFSLRSIGMILFLIPCTHRDPLCISLTDDRISFPRHF